MPRINTYQLFSTMMLASLISLVSCEEPIDIEVSKNNEEYVIDGLVASGPGPYSVIIKKTGAYNQKSEGTITSVLDAIVIIRDDEGNEEILEEKGNGRYETDSISFQGKVGNTYVLQIITITGDTLESYPETLLPVPGIDSSYYRYVEETATQLAGHEVYIKVNDPGETDNYYRWKWAGIYQFLTPWRRFSPDAGWTCWRDEFDYNQVNVMEDKFFNGNSFEPYITIIPHFSGGNYLVYVYQYSLTKSAYKFWSEMDRQRTSTGGVFDPQPSYIKGNMYNINNGNELVLGYFGASDVIREIVVIERPTGVVIPYPRSYPPNTPCWTLTNSRKVYPDPSTWPEGWYQ